jgi:hypothetical protein
MVWWYEGGGGVEMRETGRRGEVLGGGSDRMNCGRVAIIDWNTYPVQVDHQMQQMKQP